MVTAVYNNQWVHMDSRGVEDEEHEEPAMDCEMSGTDSESEVEGEEVVWGRSGVNAESYRRKMVIWMK